MKTGVFARVLVLLCVLALTACAGGGGGGGGGGNTNGMWLPTPTDTPSGNAVLSTDARGAVAATTANPVVIAPDLVADHGSLIVRRQSEPTQVLLRVEGNGDFKIYSDGLMYATATTGKSEQALGDPASAFFAANEYFNANIRGQSTMMHDQVPANAELQGVVTALVLGANNVAPGKDLEFSTYGVWQAQYVFTPTVPDGDRMNETFPFFGGVDTKKVQPTGTEYTGKAVGIYARFTSRCCWTSAVPGSPTAITTATYTVC